MPTADVTDHHNPGGPRYYRAMYSPRPDGSWQFFASVGCGPGNRDAMTSTTHGGSQARCLELGLPLPLAVLAQSERDLPFVLPADFQGTTKVLLYSEEAAARLNATRQPPLQFPHDLPQSA
jgi:hypothetical protein